MNTILKRTPLFASTSAWVSLWRLAGVFTVGLALLAQHASATTYNVFPTNGVAKASWPSAAQWKVIPGLETSPNNPSFTLQDARVDFVGNATYPTAYYAADASYVFFRVRVNTNDAPYTPLSPNTGASAQWTHNITMLIDTNSDNVPDYGFCWDTAGNGSGIDHQLELNVAPTASPNTASTDWAHVHMDDRDGTSSSKTYPDFNTIAGHTNDGYLRLVGNQDGPGGANTTTFVEFAVKWSYLTETYSGSLITTLNTNQSWRVQFASMKGNDQANVDRDVAGSINGDLTKTLANSGSWSGTISPQGGTYTWTGAAGGSDYNWGTGANWDAGTAPVNGADLVFPSGLSSKAPINDIGGTLSSINSVVIADSGYDVTSSSGTTLAIVNGFTNSSSSGVANWRINLSLSQAQTFSATTASASMALLGTLNLNSFALTITGSGNMDQTALISGTGGITKNGTGKLSLANLGSNTYTGKTTVNQGTLFIIQESNLGANPGSLAADQLQLNGGTLQAGFDFTIDDSNRGITLGASGGTLSVDSEKTLEVKKIIAGAGNLTKTGPGMLKLSTATSTYTGKTIVSEGTLAINSESRLGSNPGTTTADQLTIQNSATLNIFGNTTIDDGNRGVTLGTGGGIISVDESTVCEIKRPIAGAGSLTKVGIGSLKLSTAANTYTDKTIVTEGILMIDNETRLGNNPAISTADQLTISGGATLEPFASFTIDDSNRGILLGAGGGIITVDDTFTLTVANPIGDASGGNALTKAGAGTLTISATSTYSGATTVSEGRLNVDGSLASGSAVTVAYGATLGGTGTAAGTIDANGALAPGNGIGTLNTGAESWNSGGSYEVQINDATGTPGTDPGWDLLNLSGGLAIAADSGTPFIIKVVSLSGSSSGSAAHFDNTQSYTWRIATAAGGVTGFDVNKLTIDDSGFQNAKGSGQFTITQSGNDVYLQFASPLIANPITLGRGWGTFLRIPVASVMPNTSGGTGERTLYSVTSRDQDYVQISGAYILFAPTGNATRILDYTVADSATPTAHTASSTITVTVTNAVGLVNDVSSTGGGVTIRLAGIPGFNYVVERSSSASDWTSATTVQTLQAPTTGVWTFTDSSPPNPSFYRLRQNN